MLHRLKKELKNSLVLAIYESLALCMELSAHLTSFSNDGQLLAVMNKSD